MTKRWWIDAGERTGLTFLETFVAVELAAGADMFSISTIRGAAVAGVAAALAFVKSLFARKVGDSGSASLAPSV